MAYYRLLFAVLVVLITSVFMQGENLFRDEFFLIAYIVMALALFIGFKYKKTATVALGIGLMMIFSIGALSTWVLIEMFMASEIPVFKLAVVISLDVCAILFLHEGRRMRPMESRVKGGILWNPVE